MAKAYSRDLRERIYTAWQAGQHTRAQLATRFGVSVSCVRDLIRRGRQTGSVAAKAHGGGARRKADARQDQLLAGLVAARSDDTLEEYRVALAATPGGAKVSGPTISRMLARLRLTQKKESLARRRAPKRAGTGAARGVARPTRGRGGTRPGLPR